MKKPVLHLIGNAHIDPVWLWDRAEGMAEAVATVRAVVSLMHERPEMTFIRGESLVYEEVQRRDPKTFAAIRQLVKAGRWDIVGGNYLQPDMNLPSTETLARIFSEGQRYFRKNFGKTIRAGWSADCFGHSAGLPDILQEAGLRYYAFGRPGEGGGPCGLPQENVFWWRGSRGGRVLAHRTNGHWYGAERGELPERLDKTFAWAMEHQRRHAAVFYGLGNHGGGPSRRQLEDIDAWTKAHPEIEVVHSGLHLFFAALEKEIRSGRMQVPEFSGELNFALRGVYSAGAKLKFAYRRAEAALVRAERASQDAGLAKSLPGELWRGLLFNTFHDILPASCTEPALEQQIDEIRGLCHSARIIECDALAHMAGKLNSQVPPAPRADHPQAVPFVLWNPLDREWSGLVEIEAGLDYRPLFGVTAPDLQVVGPSGKSQPFQVVSVGNNFMPNLTWRVRVLTRIKIPARTSSILSLGWVPGCQVPSFPKNLSASTASNKHSVSNGWLEVNAKPGASFIELRSAKTLGGKPGPWIPKFKLLTMADPWGPWGGHYNEPGSSALNTTLATWKVSQSEIIESGPFRSALAVKLEAGKSEAELVFQLEGGLRAIRVLARVFWHEENARLKMSFPVNAKQLELQVPGGAVRRGECGEGPGGRWVRAVDSAETFAISTDALYDFDLHQGALQTTIVRSSHYTQSESIDSPKVVRGPVIDRGEYCFRFILTDACETIERLAEELEFPPVAQMTWAKHG